MTEITPEIKELCSTKIEINNKCFADAIAETETEFKTKGIFASLPKNAETISEIVRYLAKDHQEGKFLRNSNNNYFKKILDEVNDSFNPCDMAVINSKGDNLIHITYKDEHGEERHGYADELGNHVEFGIIDCEDLADENADMSQDSSTQQILDMFNRNGFKLTSGGFDHEEL